MYKNKKKDISYILKKPIKLTSTDWQIFFSSDYSTPNLLPPNPAILKTTVNILEKTTKQNHHTLSVPEKITKKPFLTDKKRGI